MDAKGAKAEKGRIEVGLKDVLRHPGRSLEDLGRDRKTPWGLWALCAGIAVLGSLFYGFSLVRVFPGLDAAGSSLWFMLSAGGAWILFGPLLRVVTGQPWRVLAQACLVTMVYGEIVLVAGALFHLVLPKGPETHHAGLWSAIFWVGLSNLVMAAGLVIQMTAVKVPAWRTMLCWIFGLNGTGAAFFFLLRGLAGGGP